jgi:two-component system, response regulator RegA
MNTAEVTRETLPSILLVDDDEVLRERLAQAMRARGYEVRTAGNGEEALREIQKDSPEMAVLDLRMPGMSGLELLKELKEQDPATRVLMLTGYGSIATAVEAVRQGAVGYLPKPADADEIIAALHGTQTEKKQPGAETPSLARAEWEHIQRVLADTNNNISEAARRLGIHRRSLQRKLHKYPPAR